MTKKPEHMNPGTPPAWDPEVLLRYLQGDLSGPERQALEARLLDDPFSNDALEGLEAFPDKEQLRHTVEMLNRNLRKRTEKKRKLRDKWRFKDQPWLWISALILLLLIVLAYVFLLRLARS